MPDNGIRNIYLHADTKQMFGKSSGDTPDFLLFELILCIESNTVMVEKFEFEILTYLYVLRSPGFIYVIFEVMYACVYVGIRVNTIASKRPIRLSSNLVCILQMKMEYQKLAF